MNVDRFAMDRKTCHIVIQNLMELYKKGHMTETELSVEKRDLKVQYHNGRCSGRGRGDVAEDDVTEEVPHGEGSKKFRDNMHEVTTHKSKWFQRKGKG